MELKRVLQSCHWVALMGFRTLWLLLSLKHEDISDLVQHLKQRPAHWR